MRCSRVPKTTNLIRWPQPRICTSAFCTRFQLLPWLKHTGIFRPFDNSCLVPCVGLTTYTRANSSSSHLSRTPDKLDLGLKATNESLTGLFSLFSACCRDAILKTPIWAVQRSYALQRLSLFRQPVIILGSLRRVVRPFATKDLSSSKQNMGCKLCAPILKLVSSRPRFTSKSTSLRLPFHSYIQCSRA